MLKKPLESTQGDELEEMLRVARVLEKLQHRSIQELVGLPPENTSLEDRMRAAGRRLRSREGLGRKAKKTKAQIKAEAKARREKEREYYYRVRKPKRTEWSLRQIKEQGAAGWWDILRRKSASSWAQKDGWEITKEDFVEAVGNTLEGHVCVVFRYNTKEPWTLRNIYIKDCDSHAVLFDGTEHYLRSNGYIL